MGTYGGAGTEEVPALCFREVGFRYPGASDAALLDVDLRLDSGEMLAVVGGNGSGKSTLVLLAAGIHRPETGEVRVCGLPTGDPKYLWEVRRRVGLLFQDPDDQIIGASVEDDVAFGLENLGVPRSEMVDRVREVLRSCGLEGERSTEPHLLSGGQRQQLAFAGVLAVQPSIWVLDEPTSMLDAHGRAQVLDTLGSMRAESGAVVLVTQRMEEILLADRVLALHHGRVVYQGSPRELFSSEAFRILPLEDPPAAVLARQLRRMGRLTESRPGASDAPLAEDELLAELATVPGASVPQVEWTSAADSQSSTGPSGDDECAGKERMCGGAEGGGGQAGPGLPTGHSPATPAAALHGVRVIYDVGTAIARRGVEGVDLEVASGRITAVVGATASGKSTLLQVIAGLVPQTVGWVDVAARIRTRPGTVTLLFQHAERQLYCSTVEDDVAAGLRFQGIDQPDARERAHRALRAVGLDPEVFAGRSPFGLSIGEQKRAALAGLLVLDPVLLVLDEPGAGLDPAGRRHMRSLLRAWLAGRGAVPPPEGGEGTTCPRTVVFAAHDLDEVIAFADEVVVLAGGRVLRSGPALEVLSDRRLLLEAGLEPPLAAKVAWALRVPVGQIVGEPVAGGPA